MGTRIGGHVVVETLGALGVEAVFGLPGVHALPIWEGLRTGGLRTYGFRTELNAGFGACGWSHVTGRPTPLLVSTGPGALNSLTAVMEAASAHLPVVVIASQIPGDLIGRGRGFLHELRDQQASFAPIVKSTDRAERAEDIPELLAAALRHAAAPPSGPAYVEIPVDVLLAATSVDAPAALDSAPAALQLPDIGALAEAARLLSTLADPVIWAGGGVLRSDAWREVVQIAELLDAPVATTYMGKGSIAEDHPLAAGSACDDGAFKELLSSAGVVLCVGTELGAETTAQYSLRFSGRLIQIDADPARIGASYPALALTGDARATLRGLIPMLTKRSGDGHARARAVRERIQLGLDRQGRALERHLLQAIRSALPKDAVTAWDMTILGYWAAAHFPALAPRRFLYPLGSGTLGFAWPAALGAKAAAGETPSLAVVGDGGIMYGLSELLTARQHTIAAKLLLIDDGGYGILREYQRAAYEESHGVDLAQPDFLALIAACGIPARSSSADRLEPDLKWALEVEGPAAVVLRERLGSAAPTD